RVREGGVVGWVRVVGLGVDQRSGALQRAGNRRLEVIAPAGVGVAAAVGGGAAGVSVLRLVAGRRRHGALAERRRVRGRHRAHLRRDLPVLAMGRGSESRENKETAEDGGRPSCGEDHRESLRKQGESNKRPDLTYRSWACRVTCLRGATSSTPRRLFRAFPWDREGYRRFSSLRAPCG